MSLVPAVEILRVRGARAEQLVAGRQRGGDLQRARAPTLERGIERRAVAAVARKREAEIILDAQARVGDLPAGRAREAGRTSDRARKELARSQVARAQR